MDLSIFTTPDAWISLVTLIFLEIVLGVDNIVFIAITSDRLPADKQALGRKLGLAGALVSRIIFLCFASWLVHMNEPLFTIPFIQVDGEPYGVSVRMLVLFLGGLYLIYKGVKELHSMMNMSTLANEAEGKEKHDHLIGLPQAILTIMVMDVVFSIDSVITAVGLADHLIIMIIAVMVAVFFMMLFIDAVSEFINSHVEMTILALVFIAAIGCLLVFDGLGITTGIEVLGMHMEKLMVYFAMVFAVILEVIQMRYNSKKAQWLKSTGLADGGKDRHPINE
ncbi:MAG: TerC family protein [Eggerthellaceae bacterium]